jgi:D-serine deaminase-like pyridoxal phosphate-dependent protein
MIDNISQLSCVAAISATVPSSHLPLIFLKIDTGYGRAGVVPSSAACEALIDAALAEEAKGTCVLHGLYSHAGHSYGARDDLDAMYYLVDEFAGLARVARRVRAKSPGHELVLSVGATPTTTAVQYPGLFSAGGDAKERVGMAREVEIIVAELKGGGYRLEVHAGV